ncbi:cupin domain-containing protein [uncultured Ruegeria sp.]|uniref:cupin domain-containing protein n=1 Tax=uncultured Ruegeria sp. TaxID=259304 RepID=UPI002612FC99|nr:cupin domain-containing protein [uncultured Ruegeria sp.]
MTGKAIITPPEKTEARNYVALLGEETNGQLSYRFHAVQPGEGPPLHMHLEQAETFFIVSGSFIFQAGDDVVEVGPGTTLHVPKQTPHSFRCISDEAGRLTSVLTPGIHDGFIMNVPEAQASGRPKDEVKALALEFGTEILGPPTLLEERIS